MKKLSVLLLIIFFALSCDLGELGKGTEIGVVHVDVETVRSIEVLIRWQTPEGNVTGYKVFRDGTQIADIKDTVFVDSGLEPGTMYIYYVIAYDAVSKKSRQSDSVSATTQAESSALFTTVRDGLWSEASTWDWGAVPDNDDKVIINHHVAIADDRIVGGSLTEDSLPAIHIQSSGTLTVSASAHLTSRGDIIAEGNMTLSAGSILTMDAALAIIPSSSCYKIEIHPGAYLDIPGTSSHHVTVQSNSGGAHARITHSGMGDGGRVEAAYCDFQRLGDADHYAYEYNNATTVLPFSFVDCTFDECGAVNFYYDYYTVGSLIEFVRCQWTNSIGAYYDYDNYGFSAIMKTGSNIGVTARLIKCDFDMIVYMYSPKDMVIEDCVFRNGIFARTGPYYGGLWKSFRRNFVRLTTHQLLGINFGNTFEDNVIFHDSTYYPFNPHTIYVEKGTGATYIRGNIFWWDGTASNAEGDGVIIDEPASGTRQENTVFIERNIYLPNGNGPDAENNLSMTAVSILLDSVTPYQIVFKRNTVYTGRTGGLNMGENQPTSAGQVAYVKSNLFIGDAAANGAKVSNLGGAVIDTFLAEHVDYNAGFRIRDANQCTNGPGKGYGFFGSNICGRGIPFQFMGSDQVGVNDLDDVDPWFVDPYRTPLTWAPSEKIEEVFDRLSPGGGYTMNDLLIYIREGFRPRNLALHGAGDPADGSPDMGAVDYVP